MRLTINGRARVTLAPARSSVLSVRELVMAGDGVLDLTDNALLTAAPIGAWNGDAYTGVTGLIQSGYNAGTWNGRGIVTTMPDAVDEGITSIGIATAAEAGYAGGAFRGVSVAAGDVLVMYTYAGDANLDGFISGDDYTAIDFAIAVPGASGWVNGDFNYDGLISGDDYTLIDFNIAAQGAPFPTAGVDRFSRVVPEPAAAAGVIALAASLGAARRRQSRSR